MFSCNTIVETKNVEVLENVFPLKVESVSDKPSLNKEDVNSYDDLRRSKRQRKETSLEVIFIHILLKMNLKLFMKQFLPLMQNFGNKLLKLKWIPFLKMIHGFWLTYLKEQNQLVANEFLRKIIFLMVLLKNTKLD